jgi:hypothetical protein
MFICHRINTISELKKINSEYGVEIDLRDDTNGNIYIHHDPFVKGENFEEYLKNYNHSFIILNIKSEGIEWKIKELLCKYNIINYFFLDCSFPMIINLINKGEKNIAIRYSEFESIDNILSLRGKIKYVWVDCFNILPLNKGIYKLLKDNNFKICLVSPELQGQSDKLNKYKKILNEENIFLDMICTKKYNIIKWF